jgi:hypothetical protein
MQSLYKETLEKVDFDLWIDTVIPNFEELTVQCHCQKEFQNETRCQGHLASGNLNQMIENPIILDSIEKRSHVRETTNGDFKFARQALEGALRDLFERKKMN